MQRPNLKLLILILVNVCSGVSHGECVSLIKGVVAMDVQSCGVLKPEMTFDTSLSRYRFIRNLPPKDQMQFWNSYRGMIVRGQIVGSEAVRSGLTSEKGALKGENISVFVPPKSTELSCGRMRGRRLKAFLDEACCEGGGDPPCLLNSAFVLKDIAIIEKSKSGASSQGRQRKSKIQAKAENYLRNKDYKKAAAYLEKARREDKLDLIGHYNLGFSYRQLDRCKLAIAPLEVVAKKAEKNEFWADEEDVIRRSNLLLARCYAKLNKPGFAVTVLEGFLLEPRKYARELKASLQHKDFGWIHTTKEYREYREEVHRRLNLK